MSAKRKDIFAVQLFQIVLQKLSHVTIVQNWVTLELCVDAEF